jgi:hypothetical protein
MPYNDDALGQLKPYLTADSVMKLIQKDLREAAELLELSDPIVTDGKIITEITFDPSADFYINRNYRINYFAVKALQARVFLYNNEREPALAAANIVINAQKTTQLFQWTSEDEIIHNVNPDLIFSTEIIFGVHSRNMYTNYSSFFAPLLNRQQELAPLDNRLKSVYEAPTNDLRYEHIWKSAGGTKDYKVLVKYLAPNQPSSTTRKPRGQNFQPLIRISEIYYIAAECEPNFLNGLNRLEQVRYNRGLVEPLPAGNVSNSSQLNDEIRKEYEKEFYGEGQTFYYFKRRGITSIPFAQSEIGNITMATFLFIPEKEMMAR